MEQQSTAEAQKGFLQNDRLLVCGMLAFYGVCMLGLIAAAFWWLETSRQTASANATSTAVSNATQQANATSTAVARATEQGQYKFIDRFNSYSSNWTYGSQNNDYWEGSTLIKDGVYIWKVDKVKKTFIWWTDFYHGFPVKDFDTYLDMKFVNGTPGDVCGGLVFRKSTKGWDGGAFIFTVCNNSTFKIDYHGENNWEDVSELIHDDVIQPSDWNRIEISARGNQFIFTINNEVVYDLSDHRLDEGGLAIFIEIYDENPAEIWFDNFAYQIP